MFSAETQKAAKIIDAAQETAKWKEVPGELQSSNVRNGKVKPRFLLQPSCTALNTQASKNLGRVTSASFLCLFLSLTFPAFLTHPLGRSPRHKLLCTGPEQAAVPHGGLQVLFWCQNRNHGFTTEHVGQWFPYLITDSTLSIFLYIGFSDPGQPRPLTFIS